MLDNTKTNTTLNHIRMVELFFFAYRDFTHDADKLLDQYNFARSHHRVLHFVMRKPGMTVSELLNILDVTKQSLAPVLKKLIDQSFIIQKPGIEDRRQRTLHLTKKGQDLTAQLCKAQTERFEKAIDGESERDISLIFDFLLKIADEDNRNDIQQWISSEICE